MIEYWDFYIDGYEAPYCGQGTATTLPVESERDLAAELRACVEDVTGKPCDPPAKARIGFV